MGEILPIERLSDADRRELAEGLLKSRGRELAVTSILRLWLHTGQMSRGLGVPRVTGARFEFSVPGGRIDLVLFHPDRSVTIVEAKGELAPLQIASGIGQLCMYRVLLPKVLAKSQWAVRIHSVLCAPMEPEQGGELAAACHAAGVKLVPLPTGANIRAHVQKRLARAA